MRIYEGSPRQQWEEVLRSIGAFADREQLKELLLLELEVGFVLQGLGLQRGGADSDSFGSAVKRTYELTDDQVAELMDVAVAQRGTAPDSVPHAEITNYYEHAMRVLGSLHRLAEGARRLPLRAGRLVRAAALRRRAGRAAPTSSPNSRETRSWL